MERAIRQARCRVRWGASVDGVGELLLAAAAKAAAIVG